MSNLTTFSVETRLIDGQPRKVKVQNDFYIYRAAVADLAAGATSVDSVEVEADADFIVEKITYMCDIAGASQTEATRLLPLVRCQVQDTGSGRNLFNEFVDLSTFGGSGNLPFILSMPRRFSSRSTFVTTFNNYSAATTYSNVSISYIGRKSWVVG